MKITEAAKRGKVEIVIDALAQGDGTNLQILLQKVCQDFHTIRKHDGHVELIEVLLERERERHILIAAALGESKAVREAVAADPAAVYVVDSQGMTPLHYCCASAIWKRCQNYMAEFPKICSCLIEAGAEVNARGNYHGLDHATPLFYCAWTGGHPDVANLLLQHGAVVTSAVFYAAVGHFQRHGEGHYEIA